MVVKILHQGSEINTYGHGAWCLSLKVRGGYPESDLLVSLRERERIYNEISGAWEVGFELVVMSISGCKRG
jgi:hypothetical protein